MNQYMNNFFKYLLVGGSAALINWLVFFLCFYHFGIYYLFAGVISFIIATLWNFLFAKKFIFRSYNQSIFKESVLIYLVSFGGLLIDIAMLYVCVQWLGLYEIISKILATGVAFVFNFGMRQFVIYR
ncbi:GtrA family protein [Helicobacter japonicus]|nr:GtrA family protein [Helicobacter japonicus]